MAITPSPPRPVEVHLRPAERRKLASLLRGTLQVRVQQRAQALRLLDQGWSCQQAAEAVNFKRGAVYQLVHRWQEGGLERALYDLPRGAPEPRLNEADEQRIVAMVCGPPPEGRARWTVRLSWSKPWSASSCPPWGARPSECCWSATS